MYPDPGVPGPRAVVDRISGVSGIGISSVGGGVQLG